jgi:DNA-binding NarL/FixJ family response regulator
MSGAIIVADSGAEMASLTASVAALKGVDILRFASGRTSVAGLVATHQPSLVLIGEIRPWSLALERVAEIAAVAPQTTVVVVAPVTSRWLGEALRAGATAVVPSAPGTSALRAVLEDAFASDPGGATWIAPAA